MADIDSSVQSSIQELAELATQLNVASDLLTKYVLALETSLKTLNVGVECWVRVTSGGSEHSDWCWNDELGFAKVSGKWAIALRHVEGVVGEEPDFTYWRFEEAPREKRLEAVDKLPDLLKELHQEAGALKSRVDAKIELAAGLASAVSKGNRAAVQEKGKTRQ